MNEKFTSGQQLYFVPSRRGAEPRTYTIEKVGRQYITLSNGMRAPIETMHIENFGKLYTSEEHYRQWLATDEAWQKFKRLVDLKWKAPKDATLEQINEAGKLLFGEVW